MTRPWCHDQTLVYDQTPGVHDHTLGLHRPWTPGCRTGGGLGVGFRGVLAAAPRGELFDRGGISIVLFSVPGGLAARPRTRLPVIPGPEWLFCLGFRMLVLCLMLVTLYAVQAQRKQQSLEWDYRSEVDAVEAFVDDVEGGQAPAPPGGSPDPRGKPAKDVRGGGERAQGPGGAGLSPRGGGELGSDPGGAGSGPRGGGAGAQGPGGGRERAQAPGERAQAPGELVRAPAGGRGAGSRPRGGAGSDPGGARSAACGPSKITPVLFSPRMTNRRPV
ncbi:unnamed protein product [Gadus morhua 'NCC']